MKVIRHIQDGDGFSVLVRDTNINLDFWIDVWYNIEDELRSDWNQYIFDMLNEGDQKRKDYQDSANHFMDMTSCAVDYLERLELL